MSDKTVLSCRNLRKSYEEGPQSVEVLVDVQLELFPGERVAIVGSSGSGKSTLLNMLGGLDIPSSGSVWLAGEELSALNEKQRGLLRNRALGFVYQFHHLLPEFTALENVCMPLLIGRMPIPEARERAAAERLKIEFQEADAEALPFPDGGFDAVVSTFGVMFTPDQDKAAAELMRVCRPGGKIGLANWTPDGFIGHVFKTIGKHLPPPAGIKSPALWGTRARIEEMFGAHASSIKTESRDFVFRYRSPEHWLEVFKTYYGPLLKAFGALEPAAQAALTGDLMAQIERFNRSGDAAMVVPSEYLEIVVTRR